MSSSNSTKDTVLQLSVGKLNGGQKIRHSYKSIIVRWKIKKLINYKENHLFHDHCDVLFNIIPLVPNIS
ncbi:uncharacterized protein LOC113561227 isoform X2 [Rhopalosiphum maidis]|uniref:uncharacterized protein LOC113561227 isoform X2 n=1 Tax=Rhopalosiphum maidis TaxID=43146 RepID=UPI000EFE5CF9|nr:uncharacterized protein LOC113561227 isoform X2 [Rhopalosiphum maidis]